MIQEKLFDNLLIISLISIRGFKNCEPMQPILNSTPLSHYSFKVRNFTMTHHNTCVSSVSGDAKSVISPLTCHSKKPGKKRTDSLKWIMNNKITLIWNELKSWGYLSQYRARIKPCARKRSAQFSLCERYERVWGNFCKVTLSRDLNWFDCHDQLQLKI